jgi:hypothetical protein
MARQSRGQSIVGRLDEEQRAARCESLTAVASRFGVRPLVFFGGGYLVLTAPFALVPIIRNQESVLQREKASRAADGAMK